MFDPLKSLEKHLGEFSFNSRTPLYNDDSDYNTNAPSYYDDLSRKNKLIKHLALRIWEYDDELKKRFKAWDKNLEEFDDEVLRLLQEWMDNGRFDEIINEHIFGDLNDKLNKVIYKTGKGLNDVLTGDGVETQAFQKFVNDHAGEKIIFPPEMIITIDDKITLPKDTYLIGQDSTIISTHEGVVFELNDNTTITGLNIEGSTQFNVNNICFNIVGTLGDYKENIEIKHCNIKNFGGYGVFMEFTKAINIDFTHFNHIGYAGIHGFSVEDVHVVGGSIKDVYGDPSVPNCYGVAYTKRNTSDNPYIFPSSKNCSVKNMLIEDIPKWEGLDTHGGEQILFEGNTIKKCRTGIAIVRATAPESNGFAPHSCKVINNTIYGNGDGLGISVAGVVGDYSTGILINDNTLIKCGVKDSNINGAIRLFRTNGITVSENIIIEPYELGINFYDSNSSFVAKGNTITDPHSETWAGTCHIGLRENDNEGIITNNNFIRKNTDLNNFVGVRGVYTAPTGTNHSLIDYNNDHSERGPSGTYKSIEDEVESLMPSKIIREETDMGYTVQFEQGLTFTWKTVTLDATNTEKYTIPFPEDIINSGNIGGSAALENINATRLKDYNLMAIATGVDGWEVQFEEGAISTELTIRLLAVGMTK